MPSIDDFTLRCETCGTQTTVTFDDVLDHRRPESGPIECSNDDCNETLSVVFDTRHGDSPDIIILKTTPGPNTEVIY
jgi:hypothetical protein